MKSYFRLLLVVSVLFILVTACQKDEKEVTELAAIEEKIEINEEAEVNALDVYIVGDAVHSGSESFEEDGIFYTTFMAMGEYFGTPVEFGSEGFMYHDAIERYQEETGKKVNLHWFQWPEHLEEELEEEVQADVIISTFTSMNDYYLYMDRGMFYDLTPLFEQNEIYTSGQYYNQVLKGGELGESQYIVPLLYNIDTIMGSEESLSRAALHIQDIESYQEFLDALFYAQNQDQIDQTLFQYNSISAQYLPHMIYSALGEKWVDYENWSVNVDEEIFNKMCLFYEEFLKEQFGEKYLQEKQELSWADSYEIQIKNSIMNDVQIGEFLTNFGAVMQGGGAFQTYLHSAAAQAWYYESRYDDLKESYVMRSIPNENGNVTAHISYFGAVMNSSDQLEEAFDFLKYLMDTEVEPFFGLSISKENTEKQLDYLTSTSYRIRPGLKVKLEDGKVPDSDGDYVIQPMSEETRSVLEAALAQIELATLPNWPVYNVIDQQLLSYAKGEVTSEEAYENVMNGLNEYVLMAKNADKVEKINQKAQTEEQSGEEEKKPITMTVKKSISQVKAEEAEEKALARERVASQITYILVIGSSLFFIIRRIVRNRAKKLDKTKKARVQIILIDRGNGEAERNLRQTQGGELSLGSSIARGTSDMVMITMYQLDKNNKKLRLKVPLIHSREIKEGDIADITYVGEELLTLTKIGSVNDIDRKGIKRKL